MLVSDSRLTSHQLSNDRQLRAAKQIGTMSSAAQTSSDKTASEKQACTETGKQKSASLIGSMAWKSASHAGSPRAHKEWEAYEKGKERKRGPGEKKQ